MERRITPSQVSLMKAVFCFTRAFNSRLLAGYKQRHFLSILFCARLFSLLSFFSFLSFFFFFLLFCVAFAAPRTTTPTHHPPIIRCYDFFFFFNYVRVFSSTLFFFLCVCVCCRRPFNSFYLALVTSLRYYTYPPTLSL